MSKIDEVAKSAAVRTLNDAFRQSLVGRSVVLTSGVSDLSAKSLEQALNEVKAFDRFAKDNDPYGEHDFSAFDVAGQKLFFKIDYYDPGMEAGSDDPTDPLKTTRVLTLMLAEEY